MPKERGHWGCECELQTAKVGDIERAGVGWTSLNMYRNSMLEIDYHVFISGLPLKYKIGMVSRSWMLFGPSFLTSDLWFATANEIVISSLRSTSSLYEGQYRLTFDVAIDI